MTASLGLVAGGGGLPRRLIGACRAQDRPVFVFAFRGITDAETVAGTDHAWCRLGGAAQIKRLFKERSVGDICFAGRFRRPSLLELAPDAEAARFLAKVGWRSLGDSGLMDAIAAEVEAMGHRLVAPKDILGGLLSTAGPIGRELPDDLAQEDIRRARAVARHLGLADAGQGVVVQQGVVLAIEAAEGTDAMLARCRDLGRPGPGGVLVKARKPQQDDRLDLPTIGPGTVRAAHAAGLRGIAVEAGAALVVDAETVARRADELGLFVVGLDPDPVAEG